MKIDGANYMMHARHIFFLARALSSEILSTVMLVQYQTNGWDFEMSGFEMLFSNICSEVSSKCSNHFFTRWILFLMTSNAFEGVGWIG